MSNESNQANNADDVARGGSGLDPNRPSAYWDDNKVLKIRASALGQCPKALAAIASGVGKAQVWDAQQKAFDRGHRWEDALLEMWEDDRLEAGVVYERLAQHRVKVEDGRVGDSEWVIEGALDAVYLDDRKYSPIDVVDAKTMSVEVYEKNKHQLREYLTNAYEWQLRVYMEGVRELKSTGGVYPWIALGVIEATGEEAPKITERLVHYETVDMGHLFDTELTNDELVRNKGDQVFAFASYAQSKGIESLAKFMCFPGAFPCPVERMHPIIDPPKSIQVPQTVTEALGTMQKARADQYVALTKAEKAARAVVREYLLEARLTGEHRVGDWVLKLTEGEPTEKVTIDAANLRALGAMANIPVEEYIEQVPGRMTFTPKYDPQWGG